MASCALFIADRFSFDRVKLLVSDLSLESVECWEVDKTVSIGGSAVELECIEEYKAQRFR
jgi:hypothetical protein